MKIFLVVLGENLLNGVNVLIVEIIVEDMLNVNVLLNNILIMEIV
jgi:hypothetical protein